MLCNAAINTANIEGGKIPHAHTHNRNLKLFKMLDFRKFGHIDIHVYTFYHLEIHVL